MFPPLLDFTMGSRQTATVATAGFMLTATGPIATSTPVPQPRVITNFCWILGVSTSEFPVDIEDSLSVGSEEEFKYRSGC